MIKFLRLGVLIFLAPVFAYAACSENLTDTRGVLRNLIAAISPVPQHVVPECDSLRLVLSKVSNMQKPGGRKLEADQPFNEATAYKDLEAARSDKNIHSRIAQIQREVMDGNARLALEAAVMDEKGHYDARDLLIWQLSQRLK